MQNLIIACMHAFSTSIVACIVYYPPAYVHSVTCQCCRTSTNPTNQLHACIQHSAMPKSALLRSNQALVSHTVPKFQIGISHQRTAWYRFNTAVKTTFHSMYRINWFVAVRSCKRRLVKRRRRCRGCCQQRRRCVLWRRTTVSCAESTLK